MHGANDAQKTMGIIAGVLFTTGYIETFHIPIWVELSAYSAIGLGTLSGGWRIIHTMGSRLHVCSRWAVLPPRPALPSRF